jgi:hypothetical protein
MHVIVVMIFEQYVKLPQIIIIIIITVQPFVGPWPLFQFLDPIHSRSVVLDGGSARRKAAT